MYTRLLPVKSLFACALLAVVTVCTAEVPPVSAPPVKSTRALSIKQALRAAEPVNAQQTVVRHDSLTRENYHDTPKNVRHLPNGCDQNSGSLCYDYRTGRALYKPMRKLLPDVPGLTPHNLSIHRDKIVAQYTFK